MFKAIDETGREVGIDSVLDNSTYYCPICRGQLIIKAKNSESVVTHFAHKSLKDCDTFSHDMSDWHKAWQNRFPIKNQEVPLPFDKPCHRADVLAYGYVIEFQHSPISVEEFDERNRFYTSLGKKVVWIFDVSEKYKDERFSKKKAQYIYDGEYTDSNGRLRKKWIVNEYRIGNTFSASLPFTLSDGNGVDYEYGRNEVNESKKTYEWEWKRPLNNLIHYNPMVNKDIIVFLEFSTDLLQKIIWCDDVIDKTAASSIALGLHEYGAEFFEPSIDRYLEYRNKFIIKSDFRAFSATEYNVKQFISSIINRQL